MLRFKSSEDLPSALIRLKFAFFIQFIFQNFHFHILDLFIRFVIFLKIYFLQVFMISYHIL